MFLWKRGTYGTCAYMQNVKPEFVDFQCPHTSLESNDLHLHFNVNACKYVEVSTQLAW